MPTCTLCRVTFPTQAAFCPGCGAPANAQPTRPDALAPGVTLCDRFRVQQRAGVEGTGVVWLAHDSVTDADVALKVLPRLVIDHPPTYEQLVEKAESWKRLDHPNIVRLHELVLDPLPFLVVENVAGDTCRTILAARGDETAGTPGVLSPAEVLAFLERLADALDHAHGVGVLHQDIKPANVVLSATPQGFVARLTNFGVSALVRDRAMQVSGQFSGGVPAYMAPEQLLDEPPTSRSDIHALASVLLHLLTGLHPPFTPSEGSDGIPAPALAVLERAMSQTPSDRPGTATLLYQELRAALGPAKTNNILPFPAQIEEKPQPPAAPDLANVLEHKEELYPKVCEYETVAPPQYATPGARLRLLLVYLRWGLLLAFVGIVLYGLLGTPLEP